MITTMKYVLIKNYDTEGSEMLLIDDPVESYKSGQYNAANGDKIFQLGNEVEVEISIKPKMVFRDLPRYEPDDKRYTVSRNYDSEGSFPHGLKGDLGVGEYRG